MKEAFYLVLILAIAIYPKAQPPNCVFKQPFITIDFGRGNIDDVNAVLPSNYERVQHSCPNDGHYTYTDFTSDCFSGNWHTVSEDHTAGDASGNMLLVNSSYTTGLFFSTTVSGFKSGAFYEFGMLLMNVCKISDQCPFPLLPNITIRLQTKTGKTVAEFSTKEVPRKEEPRWTMYRAFFTMPPSETDLDLVMTNNNPGGCGNDFALDDITFRECVPPTPAVTTAPKKTIVSKKEPPIVKTVPKKATPPPAKSQPAIVQTVKPQKDSQQHLTAVLKSRPSAFPSPPAVLTTRTNTLIKQIETAAGEITINLYDNGEIDGDTVSIYHNNTLLRSHARLSQKPLMIRIAVDANHPHHELIMVAENLGSIPPNTSLMIINAGDKRYQVFISSTEQKNAKVVLDLKE